MPVPNGPTRTNDADARRDASARAAFTISGPMPRGSPRVTAMTGFAAALTAASRTVEDLDGVVGAIGEDLDVHVLPLLIDVPPRLEHLLQTEANARLHLVERVVAGLRDRRNLRHDEFAVAA